MRDDNGNYFVYCVVEEHAPNGPCKVGVAVDVTKRLYGLQTGNWRPLKLAWTMLVKSRESALDLERLVLGRLRPSMFGNDPRGIRRLKSEWLDATPGLVYETAQPLFAAFSDEAEPA